MDNKEKDIAQFDLLAQGSVNEPLEDELLSIQQLDNLMQKQSLHMTLSNSFTSKVMFDAFKTKRRQSRNRFFLYLGIATLLPLLLILSLTTPMPTENTMLPSAIQMVDNWLEYFSDPRMKQLFIVLEAIICLLILDKIFFSRANIKPSIS